jgi:putative hemolysin
MSPTFFIIATLICLILEGFFSGAELSLVSADKHRLNQQAALGSRKAKMANRFISNPPLLFSVTLFGQNFFIVANTVLATLFIIQNWGVEYELWALLLSPLILIFGEVGPKSYFQQHADRWAALLSPFLLGFYFLTYPIIVLLSRLTHLMLGGVKSRGIIEPAVTREGLELILEDKAEAASIGPEVKETIRKVFDLDEMRVYEIMTPLVETDGLRHTTRIGEAYEIFHENGFSRMPVFKDRVTNMIGVINIFDVLHSENKDAMVTEIMKSPHYVSELMNVDDLFQLLKEKNRNMALVVDEYGGAVGIVTMEDILEEIVGEIEDEFDEAHQSWGKKGQDQYVLDARVTIDEINDYFKWALPQEEYETLAGLVLDQLGHIPEVGESFEYKNFTFIIKEATAKSVEEVIVKIKGL